MKLIGQLPDCVGEPLEVPEADRLSFAQLEFVQGHIVRVLLANDAAVVDDDVSSLIELD
jgi:hypothetical protein